MSRAQEPGPLGAGAARPGERAGPGPQPFGRVAAAVEDPRPVEEEAQPGLRLGRPQVRRAQQREHRGPVELARGGERRADVADEREGGEGAGKLSGERHPDAFEGGRQPLEDAARGDEGDVGRREPVVEKGSGESRRRVELRVVGRGGQPHHPPLRHRARGREPDLEVAPDRELVERLEPAQPGLRRRRPGRLLGEERDAGQDPSRAHGQRRAEVEGGTGGGEEPLQDEEAEVVGLLRAGAAFGRDGGGPERTGGVERVPLREPVLVAGERRGGGEEPLADASGSGGGGGAEVGRGDLGGPKLGEHPRGRSCSAPSRARAVEQPGVARGVEGQEPLGEGGQEGAAVPGGGEEAGREVGERGHARPEEEAVLRVAEAALDPGLPERCGDDDEIGHWGGRIRGGADYGAFGRRTVRAADHREDGACGA